MMLDRRKILFLVIFIFLGCNFIFAQSNTNYRYALIEAVKQKNLGNIPGAIELYKMVLKENDSVAVAHYEIGTLYAATGRLEEAVNHLETSYLLDVDNEWYFRSYIEVLVLLEEFHIAEKLLKEKISIERKPVEHMYTMANVYMLAGKTGKALRLLNKMEKRWGFSDKITLLKANIYEKKGKFKKALEEVDRMIAVFPESVEFRVVAAEMALKCSMDDLASEYYSSVVELDSLNVYALTNLTDYYREKGALEKSFYYLNKSFQIDEIEYERKMAILSYYLSDPDIMQSYGDELEMLISTMLKQYGNKLEIRLFVTDFYIERRDYEKALKALKPLLVNGDATKYEFWRQGILLANAIRNNKEMFHIASDALEAFPDSNEVRYFKGIAAYELGKYEELVNTFSEPGIEVFENEELRSQVKTLLAEGYYRLKDYHRSDSLFRAILREEQDNFMVMNNFSYYLALREESLEDALKMSEKAILHEPENGTFLDTYAWVLYKLERYNEAEHYIHKALKFGGENDPDVNEHAGDIFRKLGNVSMAISFYEKAVILGGNAITINNKIKEIKSDYSE
ncbi:MAG: tetratricopeptide repeat protein [Bacteroidales bacterium]|nr:tetratricopeptide repeat protein [Bacteroidales bacterium]